jgi:hypothetical protein
VVKCIGARPAGEVAALPIESLRGGNEKKPPPH